MTPAGPLTGAEVLPIVQASANFKVTTQNVADLALPAISVLSVAVSVANAHAATASAAATSADAHASTASAAASAANA